MTDLLSSMINLDMPTKHLIHIHRNNVDKKSNRKALDTHGLKATACKDPKLTICITSYYQKYVIADFKKIVSN